MFWFWTVSTGAVVSLGRRERGAMHSQRNRSGLNGHGYVSVFLRRDTQTSHQGRLRGGSDCGDALFPAVQGNTLAQFWLPGDWGFFRLLEAGFRENPLTQ